MTDVRLWLLTIALLCRAGAALAWADEGHAVICDIAWAEMGEPAREMVKTLLVGDPDPREETLARACSWADRMRDDADYNWAAPQHYVNIPPGGTFQAARDCGPAGCVVRAIGQQARAVADARAPAAQRRDALRFLAHFVGDLHQPLHVSHAADRGGNRIAVTVCESPCESARCPRCSNTNLHRVWDAQIVASHHHGPAALATALRQATSAAQRRAWRDLDMSAWVAETFAVAEGTAYHSVRGGAVAPDWLDGQATTTEPARLADDYDEVMRPVVDRQLQKAGVRLAAILDALAAGRVPPGLLTATPLRVTPAAANTGLVVRDRATAAAPRIAQLSPGDGAELIGIQQASARAVRWYRIRLTDGREGFVPRSSATVR